MGRFGAIKLGEHEASRPAGWRKCGCPQRRAPATGSARGDTGPEQNKHAPQKTSTRPKKQTTRPKKRTRAPEKTTERASEKTNSRPKLLPRKLSEKTKMCPPKKKRKKQGLLRKKHFGEAPDTARKNNVAPEKTLCVFSGKPRVPPEKTFSTGN